MMNHRSRQDLHQATGRFSAGASVQYLEPLRSGMFMLIAIMVCLAGPNILVAQQPVKVDFQRDIKPLLSDRCFHCHGPDEESRQADLRFDLREEAVSYAIEPGDSSSSELMDRITTDDSDLIMPPPDSHKTPLTKQQVELFRRWIDEGAEYSEHWSFAKLRSPKPDSNGSLTAAQTIDTFINRRLKSSQLETSPIADRRTLIRRLSFDLTGLPPTSSQVESFLKDESPKAYAQLVDRLIDSKHFGERMAVYWLDVVRYSDTSGYHGDNNRPHSPYRDYVINAFNDNKPYDQFVREQLAGDLFPAPTNEQKIASGFNRLNQTTREGGAQPKEYIAIYAADRVRNTSEIFLGLTMGCCQCHDHKYDPLSIRDFYRFAAFFADIKETPVGRQAPVSLFNPDQQERSDLLDQTLAQLRTQLYANSDSLNLAQEKWQSRTAQQLQGTKWSVLNPSSAESLGGGKLEVQPDGIIAVTGSKVDKDTYQLDFDPSLKDVSAIRLEVFPESGPSTSGHGNFVLNTFQVELASAPVKLGKASASFSQDRYPVASAIDGNPKSGWAISPQTAKPHTAIFSFDKPLQGEASGPLRLKMHQNYGSQHTIKRFRLSLTNSSDAHAEHSVPHGIAEILTTATDERSETQRKQLQEYFRETAPATASIRKQIEDAERQKKSLLQEAEVLISEAMAKPRVVRVLHRGNWQDESGPVVTPAIPESLGTIPLGDRERLTRLDLADWIASRSNPLTARVMVNRIWKLMLGRGLSNNLGDLGAQGEPPTHPQLLDWLAAEFIDSGWDVKHIVKLIALTDVYRRSSLTTAETLKRDPQNELFARQGRWRLDAEFIRDNALQVSGLLSTEVGGRSVRPYQPSGYLANLNFPVRKWVPDQGENQYRRGLYTFWQRTFLHPSLAGFDAPSREECTVQRSVSNTPIAALILLNDPTYIEASREFALRMIREGGETDPQRMAFGFSEAVAREITAEESRVLVSLLEKHRKEFAQDTAKAKLFLDIGMATVPGEVDVVELAAWTSVARTIFNLHEFITRE